ncbi:hypothetical protein [uncultured Streptococcus sp.]|uniref:hypothetical protein n=1 Tax=uncultured Streptococcus sp. TaxID=83427 RepID=UPI0028DB66C8|nr:hypothetical protein [uncultured Streptococcus sp.]
MFLEFFDGIWGRYTFESDKVNVLIDGLPSVAYPLGQLAFLILAYRLFIHRYIKQFTKMSPQDIWEWHKETFRKSKLSLIVLPIVYLFVFGMSWILVEDALATVTIYKDYRGPVSKTIDGQVGKIEISSFGSKSSSARINAVFIDSDGQVYDIHLINADKRIANHIRHNQSMSYPATLSFDKHGKPLYISKFWE